MGNPNRSTTELLLLPHTTDADVSHSASRATDSNDSPVIPPCDEGRNCGTGEVTLAGRRTAKISVRKLRRGSRIRGDIARGSSAKDAFR